MNFGAKATPYTPHTSAVRLLVGHPVSSNKSALQTAVKKPFISKEEKSITLLTYEAAVGYIIC